MAECGFDACPGIAEQAVTVINGIPVEYERVCCIVELRAAGFEDFLGCALANLCMGLDPL